MAGDDTASNSALDAMVSTVADSILCLKTAVKEGTLPQVEATRRANEMIVQ